MIIKNLDQKIDFLRSVQPFSELPEDGLELIASSFRSKSFSNRELIFHQGDSTSDFCVIKSGKVRVMTINESGEEACLRILTDKEVLGELSAYDGAPRCASAQAIGPCTILVMSHKDFTSHLKNLPDLALAFIKFLSEKLRWTTLFSHTLAQYDTTGRLLLLLIHYKEIFGKEIVPREVYEIDLSLTQADLASMVGAQREWVNRLLRKWRKKGLVEHQKGKITILDFPAVVSEKNRRIALFDDDGW